VSAMSKPCDLQLYDLLQCVLILRCVPCVFRCVRFRSFALSIFFVILSMLRIRLLIVMCAADCVCGRHDTQPFHRPITCGGTPGQPTHQDFSTLSPWSNSARSNSKLVTSRPRRFCRAMICCFWSSVKARISFMSSHPRHRFCSFMLAMVF